MNSVNPSLIDLRKLHLKKTVNHVKASATYGE